MTVESVGRRCLCYLLAESEDHQDYFESLYGESKDHQMTVICIASLRNTYMTGISKGRV